MNDFQQALKKWDKMAEDFKERIERQRKSIDALLTQVMFLEGTLAGLAAGQGWDRVKYHSVEEWAQSVIDKLDEMRQSNG